MPGEVYSYRGWWLLGAMEAGLDTMTEWKIEKYPENEHHSTCLFTWESIAANSNNFEGYRSKYGWITVDAHKKFICEDIYRLRRMQEGRL